MGAHGTFERGVSLSHALLWAGRMPLLPSLLTVCNLIPASQPTGISTDRKMYFMILVFALSPDCQGPQLWPLPGTLCVRPLLLVDTPFMVVMADSWFICDLPTDNLFMELLGLSILSLAAFNVFRLKRARNPSRAALDATGKVGLRPSRLLPFFSFCSSTSQSDCGVNLGSLLPEASHDKLVFGACGKGRVLDPFLPSHRVRDPVFQLSTGLGLTNTHLCLRSCPCFLRPCPLEVAGQRSK